LAGAILAPDRTAAEAPVFGATPAIAVEVTVTKASIDTIAANFMTGLLPVFEFQNRPQIRCTSGVRQPHPNQG
jgi:hypothetical protein